MMQKSKVSPIQDGRNLIKNVRENTRKQILLHHFKIAHWWRNTGQPIIAKAETKDHGWLPNGEIIWMNEAFPDEI